MLAHQDHLAQVAQQDLRDQEEKLVSQAQLVPVGLEDHLVEQVQQVSEFLAFFNYSCGESLSNRLLYFICFLQAVLEPLGSQVHKGQVGQQDREDQLEKLAHLVPLDEKERLVLLDQLDQLGQLVHLVSKVLLGLKDLQDKLDLKEHLVNTYIVLTLNLV